MRYNFYQQRYIPKNALASEIKELNTVTYTYERSNKFYVLAYSGKSNKPALNCYSTTPEQRQLCINLWLKAIEFRQQQKREHAETRKNFKHTLQVGQILYSTWGYDQTNVDFYEVVAVKSSKSVLIRELATQQVEDSFMEGNALPQQSQYIGEPMLKRVAEGNRIKIESYSYASPWHGRPVRFSTYA